MEASVVVVPVGVLLVVAETARYVEVQMRVRARWALLEGAKLLGRVAVRARCRVVEEGMCVLMLMVEQ